MQFIPAALIFKVQNAYFISNYQSKFNMRNGTLNY
jgi:hypothetical protein